jgi:hypothetical protein
MPRAIACAVEALGGALAGQELLVVRVVVAGQQVRGFRVGARNHEGRNTRDVRGQARRHQLVDGFVGGHQHLAAHVPAFLRGGELVFEVHAGRAGANHGLGQLEGIEVAAETGLGIRDDGRQPVDAGVVFERVDLVRAQQRIVDALDHLGDGVDGVQALVRVHLSGAVAVTGHLPAGAVDSLQSRLHRLHGLVARDAAEPGDDGFLVQQLPEFLRSQARERVFDVHRAAQPQHVGCRVGTLDAAPAWLRAPLVDEAVLLCGAI